MKVAIFRRCFGRLILLLAGAVFLAAGAARAGDKPRARLLGIPFDGAPGPLDAITDVAGVEVGFTTLISGEGTLKVGEGPVRTGVTAVLPRGHEDTLNHPVFAGGFSLNGNGEMTGMEWVDEGGFLEGPVLLTNTHSVGTVRDAVIKWRVKRGAPDAERLLVEPAGRRGDLRRLPQRRERFPRQGDGRFPRHRQRQSRSGRRGQRGRRHGHDLLRV